MKTFVMVVILVQYLDKYLIAKRSSTKEFSPNEWEFISGFSEEKEPAEETILRELREETSLQGEIVKSAKPFTIIDEETRWIILPYLINVNTNKFTINPSDHSEIKWINSKKFSNYPDLSQCMKGFKE